MKQLLRDAARRWLKKNPDSILVAVIKDWLTRNREDSDRPMDEAWLRSLGWRHFGGHINDVMTLQPPGGEPLEWPMSCGYGVFWYKVRLRYECTRGEFRDLCRGLRVPIEAPEVKHGPDAGRAVGCDCK